MSEMNGYEALSQAFVAEGVDHVFALLGDANMYCGAVMAQKYGVHFVPARHEHCACAMADGYARYTGKVGVAEIAVTPKPRITDAASLDTMGAAYAIAPEKIEKFLTDNWPIISKLLTDHGPWEGYNISSSQVIKFQTTAHTLSLVLGFIGTGSEHMKRYLDSKKL